MTFGRHSKKGSECRISIINWESPRTSPRLSFLLPHSHEAAHLQETQKSWLRLDTNVNGHPEPLSPERGWGAQQTSRCCREALWYLRCIDMLMSGQQWSKGNEFYWRGNISQGLINTDYLKSVNSMENIQVTGTLRKYRQSKAWNCCRLFTSLPSQEWGELRACWSLTKWSRGSNRGWSVHELLPVLEESQRKRKATCKCSYWYLDMDRHIIQLVLP